MLNPGRTAAPSVDASDPGPQQGVDWASHLHNCHPSQALKYAEKDAGC